MLLCLVVIGVILQLLDMWILTMLVIWMTEGLQQGIFTLTVGPVCLKSIIQSLMAMSTIEVKKILSGQVPKFQNARPRVGFVIIC